MDNQKDLDELLKTKRDKYRIELRKEKNELYFNTKRLRIPALLNY
jgi:hypothetical protein